MYLKGILIVSILLMYLNPAYSQDAPITPAPTTSAPTTSAPTTSEPTTSAPTTSEPTTSAPTTSAPTTSAPTPSAPTIFEPTTVAQQSMPTAPSGTSCNGISLTASPPAPSSVSIALVDSKSITVNITDPSMGFCGNGSYYIEVYKSQLTGDQRVYLRTVPPMNGSMYTMTTIPDLTSGQTYYVIVAIISTFGVRGSSLKSNQQYLQPLTPVPQAPSNVQVTPTEKSLSVSWNASQIDSSASIANYMIVVSPDKGLPVSINVPGSVTTGSVTGLFSCTRYVVNVIALSNAVPPVPSPPSTSVMVNTNSALVSMTSVFITQATPNSLGVLVSGSDPICNSTFTMTVKGNGQVVKTLSSPQRPTSVSDLTTGTSYTVSIAVLRSSDLISGNSITSNQITLTSSTPTVTLPVIQATITSSLMSSTGAPLDWVPDYSNSTSDLYTKTANQFCSSMQSVIANSGSATSLTGCAVNSFQSGSVIVNSSMNITVATSTAVARNTNVAQLIATGIQNTPPGSASYLPIITNMTTTTFAIISGTGTLSSANVSWASTPLMIGAQLIILLIAKLSC